LFKHVITVMSCILPLMPALWQYLSSTAAAAAAMSAYLYHPVYSINKYS